MASVYIIKKAHIDDVLLEDAIGPFFVVGDLHPE